MPGMHLSIDEFVETYKEETILLLKELAVIPAPSHNEKKRGQFCLEWMKKQGAEGAYIDEAGNVIFPYHYEKGRKCAAVMAHMDVVFPDTEPLPVIEEEERISAPGIGDDTANLVNLLMCIKYVLKNPPDCEDMGILFVADICEEGFGNLKGSRAVFEQYGEDIIEMISFDIYLNRLVKTAVGSNRYRISVRTRGGHSYQDFGETSAIQILAGIISDLYTVQVPEAGKTTYNVGTIEGGTSVNTIAEFAAMSYEFRSDCQEAIAYMEERLWHIVDGYRSDKADIEVELLGVRPCGSEKVKEACQTRLAERQTEIIERYTGKPVQIMSGSTDANIPLSMGIPAVTFGTVDGAGAHTYEEWIDKKSMVTGQKIALASILYYLERE